jgi:hypothetical protein
MAREVASGAKPDRTQLRRLLDQLDAGGVVMLTPLDRLARSTRDLLNILALITGKKAGFKSIGDTWADTTAAHGRLMLTSGTRQGARHQARPQTEIDRSPEARGDPTSRLRRRASARDRPQLQRLAQHDFEACIIARAPIWRVMFRVAGNGRGKAP